MTGSRISESVQFKPMHISQTEDFYRVRMVVVKKKREDQAARTVPIPRGDRAKCHENEMMDDVLQFLKGKEPHSYPFWKWGRDRDIPLKDDRKRCPGVGMGVYLGRKIAMITEAKKKGVDGIWRVGNVEKRLHPHFLRHCRASHLADIYKFTDTKLRLFFNWSNTQIAATYVSTMNLEESF